MDLAQLANLGEFIGGVAGALGAIAVLVTLIYLAVQVKQTTELAQVTAQRDITEAFLRNLDRLGVHPEVYQRGTQEFPSMSHEDQLRFNLMMSPFFIHFDHTLRMYKQRLETREYLDAYARLCLAFLQEPGTRAWWDKTKTFYATEASGYFEERLADPANLPPRMSEALPWHAPEATRGGAA